MEATTLMETWPVNPDDQEVLLQELIKNYRQAQAGRRLTGIIHAINSPLQVMLMQTELLERKLKEEENSFAPELPAGLQPTWQSFFDYRRKKNNQLQEVLTKLQQMLHKLKHQTCHEHQHGLQEIDLNRLVLEELEGYQAEQFFKNRVNKLFQQLDHLPLISGFYNDFSQSFCILIDNALEALQEVPEPALTVTTSLESGRRVIAVQDNGPGIPPAISLRIFEPFFSTKSSPEKPRIGMGLFLARRLLAPYGGDITCLSQPGQTIFRLVLP